MATDIKKHTTIASGENPTRAAIAAAILSVNDVIGVADLTERAQLVNALNSAGIGPSATRPLVVFRANAPGLHKIESSMDGTIFTPASGVLQFATKGDADAWGSSNASYLSTGDTCVAGGRTYTWAAGWYPLVPTIDLITGSVIAASGSVNINSWYAPGTGGSSMDSGFAYDASTGDITCQRAGRYSVDARIAVGAASSGAAQFYIIRNGSPTDILAQDLVQSNATYATVGKLSVATVTLAAGDKLRLWVPTVTAALNIGGGGRANGEMAVRYLA